MDEIAWLKAELTAKLREVTPLIREATELRNRLNAAEARAGVPATVIPLFPQLGNGEDGDGDRK